MYVSQVSSAKFAGRNNIMPRKMPNPTVTKFTLPLQSGDYANISITECIKNGIVAISYQIMRGQKAIESKSITAPKGVSQSSFTGVVCDFQSRAAEGTNFFKEFLTKKLLG